MSGTASVPNTFASAVTATGLQLDNNFATVVAYVNDPTNRNNFAADGGTTNTVVVSFAPAVASGYTAGLWITWKWAAANSGAVVVNPNALGNQNLVNPDGSALQSGQGPAGSIGHAAYDGTRFVFLAPPSPATKAQMQTATASATFLTPATAQHHPGVAKAWASFIGTATGTITALSSYNVASIVRTGTGTYSISFVTSFANTTYPVIGGAAEGSVSGMLVVSTSRLTSGVMINFFATNSIATQDVNGVVGFTIYGTQ